MRCKEEKIHFDASFLKRQRSGVATRFVNEFSEMMTGRSTNLREKTMRNRFSIMPPPFELHQLYIRALKFRALYHERTRRT